MNITVSTMDDLQNSLHTVNDLMGGIKNIADQTNLLALNAAREIATVFNNVKRSSDISNTNVKHSVLAFEKVSNQFALLLGEIDMLSAVSQQNSAVTEENVSSIYEENKLLEAIGEATGKLQTLNRELISLTK